MPADTVSIRPEGRRLVAIVPWQSAEAIASHLRSNQVPATVVLDPAAQEARIEPWPEADIHRFQFHLAQWDR